MIKLYIFMMPSALYEIKEYEKNDLKNLRSQKLYLKPNLTIEHYFYFYKI